MATETELKLSLPAAAAARLRRHPLLASVVPESRDLANCYYDTPDLDLWRAKVALRHRRTADGWLLTVKSAEPAAGGLAQRSEWEAPSEPDVFDFSHVDDKRLRRRLEALRPDLQPAFVTDFRRTAWRLEPEPGVRIELALDRGGIRHGEREEAICEVELELLAGPVSALFDLGLALQADLPLRPEAASKAERGYRLFTGGTPQPVRAGKSPLDPGQSPVAAFRAVAFACLDQLLRNEAGVRTQDDPEFLHQARVAVRRLRSALRLWKPLLPADFVDAHAPAWQAFAHRLGAARNFDVLVGETLPPLLAAFPDDAGLQALVAGAERQRQRARRAARAAIAAPDFGRLVLAFSAALQALPGAGTEPPPAKFYTQRLRRLRRRIVGLGDSLAETPENHHRLRIKAKHLRYALEFLAPVFGRKAVRGHLSALSALQESLGQMNDLHFAATQVARRPRAAGADLLQAWAAARTTLLLEQLPAMLATWRTLDAPRAKKKRRR